MYLSLKLANKRALQWLLNVAAAAKLSDFTRSYGLCNIYSSCRGSVPVAFEICPLGLRSHSNPASGGLRCIAPVTFPKQWSSVEANHSTTKIAEQGFRSQEGEEKDLHSSQSGSRSLTIQPQYVQTRAPNLVTFTKSRPDSRGGERSHLKRLHLH